MNESSEQLFKIQVVPFKQSASNVYYNQESVVSLGFPGQFVSNVAVKY